MSDKQFKENYNSHLNELKKRYPELTMIGADGSPRGARDLSPKITIPQALKQLQSIVASLQKSFPNKKFTLDGRLVGDLGEILVESAYDIKLFSGLEKHHDAKCSDGRLVQIKTTMKESLTFPCDHIPDYYLGIKILPDGSFMEVFNGPGKLVFELKKNSKQTKNNLWSVSVGRLINENEKVKLSDRIPTRK